LPEEKLREKSRVALLKRGAVGGAMLFHGYLKDRKRGVLVWNPHYHALGFIAGGLMFVGIVCMTVGTVGLVGASRDVRFENMRMISIL
jgi:hypothetical protein